MLRTKKDGQPDKRGESSAKNVVKARAKLSQYVKKGIALRDGSDEESESDQELIITRKPPKKIKKPKVESESEEEVESPDKPKPPTRCHSSEIDDIRQQLLELRGQFSSQPVPIPAPTPKERDPVVHAMRQQLIASALRF